MLFLTGHFFHTIDAKSRVTIPAKLREVINTAEQGYGFVAVVSADGILCLYTPAAYHEIAPQFDPRSQTRAEVRDFRRLAYGLADQLEIDRLGRILIPEATAKRCGLKRDVAIVGVQDHIEVWPRDRWEEFLDARVPQQDELADRAMSREREGQKPSPPAEGTA